MHYAHSLTGSNDKSQWQELSEHLRGVELLAMAFARPFGVERAAGLAGLLHDLGKYTDAFQARLEGSPIKVDHATAGAVAVRALARDQSDRWGALMAQIISYAIAGHHVGLPDWRDLSDRLTRDRAALDPRWQVELSVDAAGLKPPLKANPARIAFQLGFLGRMIFSCVVDADFKDTESFYDAAKGRHADRDWPRLPAIIDGLIARFDAHMAAIQAKVPATPVNRLRRDILTEVRRKAGMEPGLFTLTVPTGGGKTLASLGFALDLAKRLGLERIVYAIPFTSVIDQTAAIFRDVLGNDVILEHHSAIEEDETARRDEVDKLRLAMEDWAAPIVVTTNVQLFESLFASRSSRCRKLHNLANSVIVLDEAQTLPLPLLKPSVAAIDELARNYGVSVVLCTATQPALDLQHFDAKDDMGLALKGRELAPDPPALAVRLKRVTMRDGGALDDAALVAELHRHPQALAIVNSRKHALDLYRRARGAGLEGAIHLSTRHYAAQRRMILDEVRKRLEEGRPCRLIATSLVEAGIDLDFPRVWRAQAGLDQIAQAAGRCNREGRRPIEDSIVTVFSAPDNPPPREVFLLSAAYARMANNHADHLSPAALEDYFREVYWAKGAALDRFAIMKRFRIDSSGLACDYDTVAKDFRMIDSGMVPVIVAHDARARKALKMLGLETVKAGTVARKLQAFVVQVPPKARALLLANGHVRFEREDLFGAQFAVLQTVSLYREDVGLLWEEADYLGLEDSIF
jgi:CRISPR-associated endonuclease/helicase Cas3